jgi:NTP pyrophosphatase (non-canonical NTP hydrolase)
MNLDDYQQAALRTINPSLDERDRLLDAAAGLAEEAAEVLGAVRKRVFQQRDISEAKLIEELGDVLWCLAVTSHTLGIPLSRIAEGNQEKLRKRHPENWTRSPKE